VAHVCGFFHCPFDIHVWKLTSLWGTIHHTVSSSNSAIDAIFLLLETLSAELNQRLVSLFWSLWKHRNLKVWDDVTEVGVVVVERAKNMVGDWQLANSPSVADPTSSQQAQQPVGGGVHPPSTTMYLPMFPFGSGFRRVGTIVILMRLTHLASTEGIFVWAKVVSYPCRYSVDVGEALGLHSTLQWLSVMQFDNINFETDSKLTCDAFHTTRDDYFEFWCIISSCRTLVSSFLTNSTVEFVRRQANGVAHALAGEATLLASPAIYFHILECIESLIINEML